MNISALNDVLHYTNHIFSESYHTHKTHPQPTNNIWPVDKDKVDKDKLDKDKVDKDKVDKDKDKVDKMYKDRGMRLMNVEGGQRGRGRRDGQGGQG